MTSDTSRSNVLYLF